MMTTRKATVEHPYGTIKTQLLANGFIVRGKEMVQAECSLAHLAYNLKKVLKIMKFEDLIQTLSKKVQCNTFFLRIKLIIEALNHSYTQFVHICRPQLTCYTKFRKITI